MRTTCSAVAAAAAAAATTTVAVPLRLAHHALLLLLVLSTNARNAVTSAALATAPKPTDKQRIEIRVQDFSFSDGPSEQQVIEIEAQDMRGSEIYDAILAIAFDNSRSDAEPSSPEDEQLSHQDALLLVVLVLCSARLLLYGVTSCWSLVRRCVTIDTSSAPSSAPSSALSPAKVLEPDAWSPSPAPQAASEPSPDTVAERLSRQSALLRLCHLQFAVLAGKLRHELSDQASDASVSSDTIASLPRSLLDDPLDPTLADIVRVLEQIPLKARGLSTERIERQMRRLEQDVAANSVDVTQSVPLLQDLYTSLQAIQHTLETRKRTQRRRPRPLQDTLALPQGFTADMFASLGQAMRLQTAPRDDRIANDDDDDETKRKQD